MRSDGKIYGACKSTSSSPNGYIWSLTTTGMTLHDFNGSTEGAEPIAPFLATDGNLYGVTLAGGGNGRGTFYKFSTGTAVRSLTGPLAQITTLHSTFWVRSGTVG